MQKSVDNALVVEQRQYLIKVRLSKVLLNQDILGQDILARLFLTSHSTSTVHLFICIHSYIVCTSNSFVIRGEKETSVLLSNHEIYIMASMK